jgi:hypothetical protein
MSDDSDASARLLPRIREGLDKLPLTAEQKAEVAPKILASAHFLDTNGRKIHDGNLRDDSSFFDFEAKIRSVVDRFAAEGLNTSDYLHAALKQPSLFCQSPDTIAGNITGVVDRFAAVGLNTSDYLQAALEQPSLFAQSPDTIAANITGVADRFAADGLNTSDYLQAALKQPALFTQSPDTIAANITGVADRFAADGLNTSDYLQAALKQPQLFTQSPDTIGRHIGIILDLYDNGVFTLPRSRGHAAQQNGNPQPHAAVIAFLLKTPVLLCLEDNNYVLRELHQRMTGADPSPKNIRRSRRETEYELMRHLGHDDPHRPVPDGIIAGQGPPTDEQARNFVLRALVREGYIKGARLER